MEKNYQSKLNEPVRIEFKAEKIHADLLEDYIDENGLNRSAVLRIMLIDFLRSKGCY